MPTIFVDESGSFTQCAGQDYFVIASFTVGDPRRTAKEFRKWQRNKFPREKKFQAEAKFSDSGLSDTLRLETLRRISALDVRIHIGYVHCDRISRDYVRHAKVQQGILYAQMLGVVLETYFPTSEGRVMVLCDQRKLKGLTKSAFQSQLVARLVSIAPAGTSVDVRQVDSTTDANIQIADWIAGAFAASLNKKRLGKEYLEILKANIIGEPIEMFGDR